MTSLSSHGGDGAHKNGTAEDKAESSELVNDKKIMADKLVEEVTNIPKTPEKPEATVHKSSDSVVEMDVVPEKTAVVAQNDPITTSSAVAADPVPDNKQNSVQLPAPKQCEEIDEPQVDKSNQKTVEQAPAKADGGSDDKSIDADDELAQIRKELASSEPAKVSEEPAKGVGEIESTDQSPNQREEAVEKESASKESADEPMEVDEKPEEKLDSKDENTEAKTNATPEKESVTNENNLSGKDKADKPEVDSGTTEDDPNAKAESGGSTGKSDSEVDSKKSASKADDEKSTSKDEEKSDAAKPDKDISDVNTGDAKSPVKAVEQDAAMEESKEAGTDEDKKQSEEENEDEDGEEQVPLLERPPETSGRRARKAVERFSEGGTPDTKRSSLPLEEGRGAKLADCPVVNSNIGSGQPEQVHALHQVVFGRQGRPHEFKRNLRQFSGFSFVPDDAAYTKKRDSLLRYRLDALRSLSHLLNLETKSKSREELAQTVLDFLVEPTATDTVVDSAKKRMTKAPRKGARSSRRGAAAGSDDEEEEEEEEEEEDEEEEEEEEEEVVVKKTSRKAPSKRTPAKKTPAKKTPAKRTPAKKTPAKRTPAKKTPAKKTPAKSAGRKTPARTAPKRKRGDDASASEEEEEEEEEAAAPPASKRAKAGRAPPRARR